MQMVTQHYKQGDMVVTYEFGLNKGEKPPEQKGELLTESQVFDHQVEQKMNEANELTHLGKDFFLQFYGEEIGKALVSKLKVKTKNKDA